MPKSANRNKAEGTLDRIAGRLLEAFSELTATICSTKGKAGGGRGVRDTPCTAGLKGQKR